jgi:hypothetical protein
VTAPVVAEVPEPPAPASLTIPVQLKVGGTTVDVRVHLTLEIKLAK